MGISEEVIGLNEHQGLEGTPVCDGPCGGGKGLSGISSVEIDSDGGPGLGGGNAKIFPGDPVPPEPGADVLNGGGVELLDAGLGAVEEVGDLLEGEVIVVAEAQDTGFDGSEVTEEGIQDRARLLVGERVEGAEHVGLGWRQDKCGGGIRVVDGSRLEWAGDGGADALADALDLVEGKAEVGGDLGGVGSAEEALLEDVGGATDIAELSAEGAGQGVEGAQAVEDGTLDVMERVREECRVSVWVVGLDGGQEAGDAGGLEFGTFHPVGQTEGDLPSGKADEGPRGDEETGAQGGVPGFPEFTPEGERGGGQEAGGGRGHGISRRGRVAGLREAPARCVTGLKKKGGIGSARMERWS